MLAEMTMLDLVGLLVSFALTVMVLLYAFDDNPLFRLAIYLFIGVAAGYASAVALKDVILPRLLSLQGTQATAVILWIVLLAMKLSPRTARVGNPAAGLLVGVGAAVGFFIRGIAIMVGTVATVAHFHFGAKPAPNQIPQRHKAIEAVSKVGQFFIAVTFGVLFTGIYSAALTALIERLIAIYELVQIFISGL
jgi:hypothetical protein